MMTPLPRLVQVVQDNVKTRTVENMIEAVNYLIGVARRAQLPVVVSHLTRVRGELLLALAGEGQSIGDLDDIGEADVACTSRSRKQRH